MPAIFLLFLLAAIPSRATSYPPQVAGSFYPADPKELAGVVDSLIAKASTAAVPGAVVGALVPHAGYEYSGPTAARVYRLLKGRRLNTVYILATGHLHAVPGAATLAGGALVTPLGEVPVDAQAAAQLMALTPLVQDMPEAYQGEHSVEVQLPFLQRALPKGFKVVPLLMNTEDPVVARQVGEALSGFLVSTGTVLLVSSDLSHYPDGETARAVDGTTLSALLAAPGDPAYFWRANRLLMERAGGLACTYCGESAVLAAMHAFKGSAVPRLLGYTHSGETPFGDMSRVVGYAAVVWTRGRQKAPPSALSGAQRAALLKLAREALKAKLSRGEEPRRMLLRDPALNMPAAVFVTLRRKGVPPREGLRGCIGTLSPELPLAEAVQVYAVQSALNDPRFDPVTAAELETLRIEVSRLTPPRPAAGAEEVRHGQGVTLSQGRSSGVFLPQVWEEMPDKTAFLEELCEQKAGLPRGCWKDPRTRFEVFDAEVFEE